MSIHITHRLIFPLTLTIPAIFNRQFGVIRTIVLCFVETYTPKKEATVAVPYKALSVGESTSLSIPGISPEAIVLNVSKTGHDSTVTLLPPTHTFSLMLRTLTEGDKANLDANVRLIQSRIIKRLLPISSTIRSAQNGWVREGETGLFVLGMNATVSPLEAKYVPPDWK